jgi:hypothetical protein
MKKIRKHFSHTKILDYWLEFLIAKQKGESRIDLTDVCFACGWIADLEKAHIQPLNQKGLDEVQNLHLLCSECHWASEDMFGDTYWNWFAKRNQISLIKQLASYQQ